MAGFKRIALFLLTNIAVIATISIILNLLGVRNYIKPGGSGLDYYSLLMFCLVWGMVGAFISLLLSKQMAKWAMGVKTIKANTSGGVEGEILDIVRRLSTSARIPMPEVGIYESPEINAFATGASKRSSLLAVSSGLLHGMDRNELEGVIGHEISHIANGDMITMVLIQGVVNSFAMFLSRIVSFFVSTMVRDEMEYIVRMILTIVLDILFSILGSIVVAFFSRQREYKADLGSARIAGRDKMISALQALKRNIEGPVDTRGASLASLKISGKKGFLHLFSTHPSLDNRIAALQKAQIM